MGFNSEFAARVAVDLETVAIDGAESLCEPVSAPSNYKDPAKIAAYIEEKQREQIEKAALYPWTCRIVALGVAVETRLQPEVIVCPTVNDEISALAAFWLQYGRSAFVTFNGLGFDLPVLMARSRLLGVPCPELSLDRYRSPHPDLLQILTFRGALPSRSLAWFGRRFGLEVSDETRGGDVAALFAAGELGAIADHCRADVILTRGLAQRLGVMRPLAVPVDVEVA